MVTCTAVSRMYFKIVCFKVTVRPHFAHNCGVNKKEYGGAYLQQIPVNTKPQSTVQISILSSGNSRVHLACWALGFGFGFFAMY